MAARDTASFTQSNDLPPEVRAALGRIRAGITDPADLEILRRAVAAGQVQIVSGDRAVTVGGNANDVVIVTGDGNTIITGAAASALSTAVEYDRLTHRYLASVADRWAWLTLEDTGPRVPLTDVYVMLEALPVTSPKPLGESPDLPAERQERLEHAGLMVSEGSSLSSDRTGNDQARPQPVALAEALSASNHLVILGEPGAGKSTTLQFIGLCFVRHAEGWVQQRLNLAEDRVPLLIVLRDLDTGQTIRAALEQAVRYVLQLSDADPVAGWLVDHWERTNRLLILLDGLDEARDQGWARRAIADLTASPLGRHARIVVASRRAGYVPLGASFRDYTLKPFDTPAEAETFLAGWLKVFGQSGTAAGLLQRLRQQPALRRLLDNPLILRLCAEVYAASGEIVRNRAELYNRHLAILEQRAIQRGVTTEACAGLWRVAEALAWHWHNGGANDEAATRRAMQQTGLAADNRRADEILGDLRTRLGLIVRVEGRYAFAHQTIREYLVSRRLQTAWERNARRAFAFLRPRLHLPEWREPLALLAVSMSDNEAQRLLAWIMRSRSLAERWLKRDLLLAAALVAESGKPAPNGMYRALQKALKVPFARELAADALQRIGDEQAVAVLIDALRDRDNRVRRVAAWALGRIGGRQAVDTLMVALRDDDHEVRTAAAIALGEIGDKQAVPALMAVLREDRYVRREAAEALVRIGDEQAVDALITALSDLDATVSWNAKRALIRISGEHAVVPLINALHAGDRRMCAAVAKALGNIGDAQAVPALINVLRDEDSYVRAAAAAALGQIGDKQAAPALINVLHDEDRYVRQVAAGALGNVGGKQAVAALITALSDGDSLVRWAATRALREIGDRQAVAVLIDALRDADGEVRREVVQALGQIGDRQAVAALIDALRDTDREVRRAAATALGEIGGEQAVAALIDALRDADREVRQAAVWALEYIGDRQAVPALIAALRDDDSDVREAAAAALGYIGDRQAVPALMAALRDDDSDVRKAAAAVLGYIGDRQAVPALMAALRDNNLREVAAAALGAIGDKQAVPALMAALRDDGSIVREAAAAALGYIGDRQAVPALIAALRDNNLREVAAAALGAIGDKQAVPALMLALRDSYEDVREPASEALTAILPRLRGAPPDRYLQRYLPALRRVAVRLKHPDLLRAALLLEETWNVQRDPWRDPLEPPPGWPGWRWVRRIGATMLSALALIVVALLGGAQEALAQWLAGLAAHPAMLLAALVTLALAGGAITWLAERVRGR